MKVIYHSLFFLILWSSTSLLKAHEPTEFYNGVTWSTGTNTVNVQWQRAASGTANAALFSGGNYPSENFVKFTEEWNGNTFSIGNNFFVL